MLQIAMQPETETVEFFRNAAGEVVGGTKIKPRIPDMPGMPKSSGGGGMQLPKPTAKDTLPDGAPAGGRPQNQMANRASGRTG